MGSLTEWAERHGKSLHYSPLKVQDLAVDDVLEGKLSGKSYLVTAVGRDLVLAEQFSQPKPHHFRRRSERSLDLNSDEWFKVSQSDMKRADFDEGEGSPSDALFWLSPEWDGDYLGEVPVNIAWFEHFEGLAPRNEYRPEERASTWKAVIRRYYRFDISSYDSQYPDNDEGHKAAGIWEDSVLTLDDCTFAEAARYFTRPLQKGGKSLPAGMVENGASLLSVWPEQEDEPGYY